MDVYYKFQDVFHPLNQDSTSDEALERMKFEQMMTADFIGTLYHIRNANTEEERNRWLKEAINGRHSRFSRELTRILEAPTRREGNREIDSLLVLMEDYAAVMVAIRYARTQEEVDQIIENCLIW